MIVCRRGVTVGGTLAPHFPGPVFGIRVAFRGVPVGAGAIAPVVSVVPSRIESGDNRDSEPLLVAPGEQPLFIFGMSADRVRIEAPAGGQALVDVWYATDPGDQFHPDDVAASVLVYDATAAANAAVDTGAIEVRHFGSMYLEVITLGGAATAAAVTVSDVDDAGTIIQAWNGALALLAAGLANGFGWGGGWSNTGGVAGILQAVPAPLPQRVRVAVAAQGVGLSTRVRITAARW
jgi:hypothetical protein